MTDAASSAPHITFEQLTAHLRSRKAERGCEACGANNWAMMTSESIIGLGVPPITIKGKVEPMISSFFAMVPLVCRQCASVRFFSIGAISKPDGALIPVEDVP